jgi:hypothetical protein
MLWLMGVASAEIVLLSIELEKSESADVKTRCESILEKESGLEIRTARFFMKGQGFKYRVVIEGIDTAEKATEIQTYLKAVPIDFVVVVDGQEQVAVSTLSAKAPDAEQDRKVVSSKQEIVSSIPKETKKKKRREVPTVNDVLLHAIDVHRLIVQDWDKVEQERFAFYRKRPEEGSLLYHKFYKSKNALRLDITIQKGEGMNSTTVLPDDGEAWVATDEKKVSRNAIRTRALLERFSSQNILSIPYNIASDMESKEYWTLLTVVESVDDLWKLFGPQATSILEATFYQDSWLLAGLIVTDGDGRMEYVFRDYREVGGIGLLSHVI